MSETRFTPGPWKWIGWNYGDFAQDGHEGKLWSEADQCPVLRGTTTEGEDPRVDVVNPFDGHLIAAAPDLYAALEKLTKAVSECHACGAELTPDRGPAHCEDCPSGCECHEEPDCAQLRTIIAEGDAALAKARGEEP